MTVYRHDPHRSEWLPATAPPPYDPDVGYHSAGEDRAAEWYRWHDDHCTEDHASERAEVSYRPMVTIDPAPYL